MKTKPLLLLGLALVIGKAGAETINWYSPIPETNLTSTGAPMAGSPQFQLGVFTGGFVPTADNIAQWASHWACAQATSYNPGTRVFDEILTVRGNTAPFVKVAKAYIWHRSAGAEKDEWMLFRKSDWTWPGPDATTPFPLFWNTAQADEVILGVVNPDGSPFLMKSEAIVSYDQWLAGQSVVGTQTGPNDDPDLDGVLNLLEYVFGTPPGRASAPPVTPLALAEVAGRKHLEITIPRLRNRLATSTVEVSGDLQHWSSGDAFLEVVSSTDKVLVVRDKTPAGAGVSKRFMRLKAETAP